MSAKSMRAGSPLQQNARALILYDDFASVLCATAVLEHMPLNRDEDLKEMKWIANSWQFDMLQPGLLAAQGPAVSDGASVLLLATTATQALPEFVKQWLERWAVAHRERGAVLGLVIAGDIPEAVKHESELSDFMQQLAELHSLEFRIFRHTISEEEMLVTLQQLSYSGPSCPPFRDQPGLQRPVESAREPLHASVCGVDTLARPQGRRQRDALFRKTESEPWRIE